MISEIKPEPQAWPTRSRITSKNLEAANAQGLRWPLATCPAGAVCLAEAFATDWWEGRAGRTPLHGGDRHCPAHHRRTASPPSPGSARAAIPGTGHRAGTGTDSVQFRRGRLDASTPSPKQSTESAADPVADSEHFTVQARRPGPHRPTCGGTPCWEVLRRGAYRRRRLRLRRRRRR